MVALPSAERLLGMSEALCELEALCAAFAAERMTAAERRNLEARHDALSAIVRAGDPQRYHETNEAFHRTIYAGSHNAYLAELTEGTRARIAPFSRAQFRTLGRLTRSHEEHEIVVLAILRGDRNGAAGLMRSHIELVHEAYDVYVASM